MTGCETGHDASVPYCDYFEGMLSLGPYRVPDAGRDMQRIWTEVPEEVARFQMGHGYRLPLWELVYHDCVVAQWYWGDYNNKLPACRTSGTSSTPYTGRRRCSCSPASSGKRTRRFVQSYRATSPIARATAESEMTDHRFLTSDRFVQQTAFANGVRVTVNFGDTVYRMEDGTELAAKAIRGDGDDGRAVRMV